MSARKANRSQKLFPLVNMAEKLEVYTLGELVHFHVFPPFLQRETTWVTSVGFFGQQNPFRIESSLQGRDLFLEKQLASWQTWNIDRVTTPEKYT